MSQLAREGAIFIANERAALPGFEVRLTKRQKAISERIQETFKNDGYETMPPEEIPSLFVPNEKNDCAQVVESLLSSGELVHALANRFTGTVIPSRKARDIARVHFQTNTELTMPQYRDLLGTSRKYALAMLDTLDSAMVTKKTGDIRTVFKGFDTLK